MTAKDKAKELFDKMNNKPISIEEWDKASDYAKKDLKRKVLITVDEIFEHIDYIFKVLKKDNLPNKFHDEIEYWKEVKQEIEKLRVHYKEY
jgi:hypothetical protein